MAATGRPHMNGLLAAAAGTCWCCCALHSALGPTRSSIPTPPQAPALLCYPSSRFWLSVGELSGLVVVMSAPSGSGQVQPWVVAAW